VTTNSERRRLLDKDAAAAYLSISVDTLERLIGTGALPLVRLPAERAKTGRGQVGITRRILLDVRDLDALIDRSKESFGDDVGAPTLVPLARSRRA
jgi:hypothetical protein